MSEVGGNEYSGSGSLEIMSAAENYNTYLLHLVCAYAKPTDSILDFGAGIGTFSIPLKKKGFDISAVETDLNQLKRVSESGITSFSSIEKTHNETYDYIFSLNVLEHIEDDVSLLKMCRDKIKPGGRLLIYVPAFQILYSSMDKNVGHFRRYTRAELLGKVNSAGFHVIKNEYVDCIGFFASLLFKFFGNDDGSINKKALIVYDRYFFPLSRAADMFFNRFFGKNVFLLAVRNN